ncbi:nitroreductase family protein [Candidatus Woesearchaeota archaeon]|nr:nitroreductase family protein [Candidatus Woesearchaeota archaeon]
MDLKQIIMSRYATKKFDGKKIDQKKIEELLELIRHAPSSFNIQPWKIKIITDQKLKEQLKPVSMTQDQITTSSHLLVFCANTDIMGNIDKLDAQFKASGMQDEKRAASVNMMKDAFENASEEYKLSWAQRQVYLALENALLGAKALGFDSCPMEGFDSEQYAKILNLPKHIVPTALCTVGFAADKPRPKIRFPKEDVFF